MIHFFAELINVNINRRRNRILTVSSGNSELKVGIVLKGGQWHHQASQVSFFTFKAEIHIDSSEIYARVKAPCHLEGQHFMANISNEIPHYPSR